MSREEMNNDEAQGYRIAFSRCCGQLCGYCRDGNQASWMLSDMQKGGSGWVHCFRNPENDELITYPCSAAKLHALSYPEPLPSGANQPPQIQLAIESAFEDERRYDGTNALLDIIRRLLELHGINPDICVAGKMEPEEILAVTAYRAWRSRREEPRCGFYDRVREKLKLLNNNEA